jgi:hypothetical protein
MVIPNYFREMAKKISWCCFKIFRKISFTFYIIYYKKKDELYGNIQEIIS